MDEKVLAELIDSYTEKLLREGEDKAEEFLALLPQYTEKLKPLMQLVGELQTALKPVNPSPAFRRELLVQLKSYTPAKERKLLREWITEHRRELAVGAALVGSAFSIAGVLAYFIKIHVQKQAREMAA